MTFLPSSASTPKTRRRARAALVAALALVLGVLSTALPSTASAATPPSVAAVSGITSGGSILYIKNHNVWLSSPDGSTTRQLTTDGTANTPYRNPSESADGSVIVAVQDRSEQSGGFVRSYLYEMNRSGTLLRAPFAPKQYVTELGGSCTIPVITGPQGILAEVSPDGTKIAVNPLANFYTFDCGGTFESELHVITLAGAAVGSAITTGVTENLWQPQWVSNSQLLMYGDFANADFTYTLGAAKASRWNPATDSTANAFEYPAIAGGKLATTGWDGNGTPVMRLWTAPNPPPTIPTARCDIHTANADTRAYVPHPAPDGAAVVWMEEDPFVSPVADNIYISPVGNIGSGCGSLNKQLLVAGGTDPFWGPAPMTTSSTPTLSVDDVSVTEGDSGSKTATFTITRSGSTSNVSTVTYATANGTATAGSDYTAVGSTTVTFAAGQTTKTVPVTVLGDTTVESNETFSLVLSSPTGATISDGTGVATITNDDSSTASPTLSVNDVTVTEGNSGSKSATFTITRSGSTNGSSSVTYATANGTATAGSDYTAVGSTTVTFTPGQTTKTVPVTVLGDTNVESDETFSLGLSSPTGATISDGTGLATITNDDSATTAGAAYISVDDVRVTEGDSGTKAATFTVTRSGNTSSTSTLVYQTSSESASAGSDFTAVPTTSMTFAAGETTKTVSVSVLGDTVPEGDEAFWLVLGQGSGATISDGIGVATIANDDAPAYLSVRDITVTEGNSGATSANFTITRSGNTAVPATVKYATSGASATASSDYTTVPLTSVTFAAGETTKTVPVTILGDTAVEPNETFHLLLSSPVGATLADGTGTATISNDDGTATAGPTTWLAISDATKNEGNSGTATESFTITRYGNTSGASSVKYATSNATAASGSDYTAVPWTSLSFAAGQTSKTVTVPIHGDAAPESTETFTVSMTAVVGAVLADSSATGTIVNDDAPSYLRVNDLSVTEGDSGSKAVTFTLTRSGNTAIASTVKYATANSSAVAGSDYTAVTSTSVTFAAGQTSKSVSVTVLGDTAVEADENFRLVLSSPVGAFLSDDTGVATIVDND